MLLFEVIVLSLGQNLYTLRKQRGYSQEYIASVLGVSRQAVSKWERGYRTSRTARCCGTAHGLFAQKIDAHKK